jgi:Transposase DDE domain
VLGAVPSVDAAYRFTAKLRQHGDHAHCVHQRRACRTARSQAGHGPDGSHWRERFASLCEWPEIRLAGRGIAQAVLWPGRHLGSPFINFHAIRWRILRIKVHAAVCTATGLPPAWQVETAKDSEIPLVPVLVDIMHVRDFTPGILVLDRGYDSEAVYETIEGKGMRPVIPLRQTPAVKAGKHKPPSCEHGEWTFAGSDASRGASKWRCPTGECQPASVWIKASRLHTLIPRDTDRWKGLYHRRGAVEREFGRLKNEWGALPLRVRHLSRVRLHIDLTILAQLASALAATRTVT